MDGDANDTTMLLQRWQDTERSALPASRDQHLVTGLDGERYLFDTRSGLYVQLFGPEELLVEALLAEPEAAERLIAAVEQFPAAEIEGAMAQCSAVLQILRGAHRAAPRPEQARPGYNLSLNVGMGCNLACTYCDPLGYREKTRGKVMDERTAQRALDFFFSRVPRNQVGCVTYSIGGEPLMYRKLLDGVAAYTATLREQGVRATQYLNTNGMLLTDGVVEYLRIHEIPFGISMDGPRVAHDAHRTLPGGEGTYDAVRSAAERVLAEFPRVSVSAVITATFPRPLEIYQHLLGLGFQRIIVKPVRGQPDQPWAFTPDNLCELQEGYRDYARFFADELADGRREIYAAINPHDYFARFVLRVFRRVKNGYRCGAASMANLAVAPDGTFYPCEGFVGQEEYRLGHVETGLDEAQMGRFAALYVDDRPICRDCWARYQCGGGCYLQGVMVNQDIAAFDPAECELTRFLVELAIGTLGSVERRRSEALAELNEWCDRKGWYGTENLLTHVPAPQSERIELPVLSPSAGRCGTRT